MPIRMQDRARLLDRAQNAKRESKYVEFKGEFDVYSQGAWCELIKDIVSFANSGGGVILFGVNDDGSASRTDISPILALDSADIANKVRRYTECDLSEIEVTSIERDGARLAAFVISGSEFQ